MAAQTESTRTRIERIKSDLRATTSCADTTVATLRELLSRRSDEPVQKENVGVKVPGALRRKADAAKAAATKDAPKPEPTVLAAREKYILATEVANLSLKTLADALKSQPCTPPPRSSKPAPSDSTTRKAARPPAAAQKALQERPVSQATNAAKRTPASTRPSSAASSATAGPDAGLVATAECARAAFAYLGTAEARKVVGRDGQELQLENGILALIGKLVALGLDGLALKEIRLVKRRLEGFLGHVEGKDTGAAVKKSATQQNAAAERESVASLLHFGPIESTSPALPIVATLQTYTLRIIARLKKAPTIEASWEHLQLSNESSPANLLQQLATTSTGAPKAARQLESLAQTILSLCPSISALDDGAPLQPSPETVLRLQHLAFMVRKRWWSLAKHKTNEERELVEPFAKCLVAYARRSKLPLTERYNLSKSLSKELLGQQLLTPGASVPLALITKTLCNLAQAAGLSDEALRWLVAPEATAVSTSSAAKQACRLVRIATVSLEAVNKGEDKPGLEEAITTALKALQGSLGGSSTDLESLFMEANALRRAATRSLAAGLSVRALSSEDIAAQARAISMIAASVHFSARFIGRRSMTDAESDSQQRHEDRINMAWKCTKSVVESVLTCCKRSTSSPELWSELDIILQDCCYILRRLGEEFENGVVTDPQAGEAVSSCLVKLSNAYWNTYLQLRKAAIDPELLLVAMRRSIDLVSEGSETQQEAGHLAMKLERLGEALDNAQKANESRKAFGQCIGYHIYSNDQALTESFAQNSLQTLFEADGTLSTLGRLFKALHRSYLVHGVKRASELAYYDDAYLQLDVRGAVLEWQLLLFSKTLSKNRQWDSNLNHSIRTLTDQLLKSYDPERYPVRRRRVIILLLQLSQDHPHIVPYDLLPSDISLDNIASVDLSDDEGLSKFKEHLGALCSFKLAMQQPSPPTETLRQCFATWEFLAKSASSWTALAERVGDVDSWIHDIRACVDYLNAKGEEYLALPVLHLLVTIFELQKNMDASDLVCSLAAQALQFLRLGYTGKAGLSLAKAEILINRQVVATESKLKWHTAYAEYLFRIGNTDKCTSILSAAESIARNDALFMDLSKPSATISQRLRYNSILANACYVYSLLAASKGSHKEAARYAKQCVTLNRRMWAALESKVNAQKAVPAESEASTVDGSGKSGFDPLTSMRDDRGAPIVSSNTHDALGGVDFWFMVPSLYRGLMQHSQVFANQGLLHEAIYVAEQAEKVALATRSPSLMTDNASWQAACWAQSGRPDKAEPLLKALDQSLDRKCISVAAYHSAIARVHHCTGDFDEEIASYDVLEQLLNDLTSPAYIRSLGAIHPDLDSLASQIADMSLETSKAKTTKTPATNRVQRPTVQPASRSTSRTGARSATSTRSRAGTASAASVTGTTKSAPKGRPKSMIAAPSSETVSTADQCIILRALQAEVLHRGVLANLLKDNIKAATVLIERVQDLQVGADRDIQHTWAKFKLMLAESAQQIAADFAFNTLPESTIAFPAIGAKDRRMSEGVPLKKAAPAVSTKGKGVRGKKAAAVAKIDFTDTLRQAREHLLEVHALSATHGSNHLFQQVSNALGHITVLLSAVSEARGSVHPLYAAYTSEIPKCNAMRLAQEFVESEKEQISRDECLSWPLLEASDFSLTSASDFQHEYIDIIPESWTAISLGLNEARDELYVTRFEAGVAPFVLRLPLARHASRDLDEDEFKFEDGKRDFDEIIELSDFSTRGAKDMTSREARQQWWDEREALDTRLQELLVNMENIWLGGFKGIFSQHPRQPTLLAKFRKAFEDVLNRHLPSRSKKTQPKRIVLDTRVLELFIGLGDIAGEDLDVDEELTDLIYFVIDILQFNGEANAIDEIDFDAMVIATQDALKAYHSAVHSTPSSTPHTILMLDKALHGFPWESLPCLQKLSISRLPSLAALRERLLTLRPSTTDQAAPGHYIAASSGGTSILNPGGDLANTSKTLQPVINSLRGDWTHIHSRPPTEAEFSHALGTQDLLLYFGHGSGAQFVRQKSVRRLYPGKQEAGNMKPSCATAFLFGCSSVHLTENGIYEPSGMLQSYLTAGAPAVVGMLWDVTDKDCDRFAVRAGELWGLWPEASDESDAKPTKTPKKGAKAKGKAKLIVDGERKGECRRGVGLDEAVRDARQACYLKYLNGAAAVVYGIPCYLE